MPVPVTVLSGLLGVGKTTVLNQLLTADHEYEIAVVVNDVGEVNVDADLVERHVEDDREVVELSNGCICCGIQGEFEQAVTDLALEETFDYLLVEPSGISEPAPVARQFVRGRATTFYELASVTTVIDARQFFDAFEGTTPDRRGEGEDGTRPLSDLIVEGVEFCDTLVVNKTDLVSEDELEAVTETVRTLQPDAKLVTTTFGQVDPDEIIDTGRFDGEAVAGSASWKRVLEHYDDHHHSDHEHDDNTDHEHEHDHRNPSEIYGIDSFVYHRRRPMHPERLAAILESPPSDVVRAKGWLHVAGRAEHALTLSLAGTQSHVEVAGRWIASLPDGRQEYHRKSRDIDWDEEHGDRETKLVIIGQEMDPDAIASALDDCLLTDGEQKADPATFENRFPGEDEESVQL